MPDEGLSKEEEEQMIIDQCEARFEQEREDWRLRMEDLEHLLLEKELMFAKELNALRSELGDLKVTNRDLLAKLDHYMKLERVGESFSTGGGGR